MKGLEDPAGGGQILSGLALFGALALFRDPPARSPARAPVRRLASPGAPRAPSDVRVDVRFSGGGGKRGGGGGGG